MWFVRMVQHEREPLRSGEPPLRYLRRLRLERAAHELLYDPGLSVARAATRAGYGSAEAFSRSFCRVFGQAPRSFRADPKTRAGGAQRAPAWRAGIDPSTYPAGLSPSVKIAPIGPLFGWTAATRSFSDFEGIARAMAALFEAAPSNLPWQFGGVSQPWGWAAPTPGDLRVLRLMEPRTPAPAPFLPWRLPRGLYAVFEYEGPATRIAESCAFIMAAWISAAGLRPAFAPLFTLLSDPFSFERAHAKIHAPVEPVCLAGEPR